MFNSGKIQQDTECSAGIINFIYRDKCISYCVELLALLEKLNENIQSRIFYIVQCLYGYPVSQRVNMCVAMNEREPLLTCNQNL